MCKGSASMAEVTQIEMTREHAAQTEAQHVERAVLSKI